MARRRAARRPVERLDLRGRIADSQRRLIDLYSELEGPGFRLPYRATLEAIDHGHDLTVAGWQISDIPGVEPHSSYVLHSDNTLTLIDRDNI